MGFEKIISEQRKKIIEELIKKGYANKSIEYSEFLVIYEDYKELMSEKEFAYLLGLNYDKYRYMKQRGTKPQILKTELTEEMKTEIREELLKNGYANKMISYEEFLNLYEKYKLVLTEKDFAIAIAIPNSNYSNMKNRKEKVTILRTPINEKAIREEVEKEYESKYIEYNEFLQMYEKYKGQINNEAKFAAIIGIGRTLYQAMKNRGIKTKILKQDDISEDLKKEIIEEAISGGWSNKQINYEELLKLYKPYKNKMSEMKFASILGIADSKYNHIKYRKNAKTYVLKKYEEDISAERKKEITDELILEGYANKNLDYETFLKLYSKYKDEMKESKFAEIIGIDYKIFSTLKANRNNAIILKTKSVDEKIKMEILENPRVRSILGQRINYEMFLDIYKEYSNYMTEIQFAQIIGISFTNYYNLKRNSAISDMQLEKRERLSHLVKESRRYSQEEILEICRDYSITEEEFLEIIYKDKEENTISEYKEILDKKGLFIGQSPISNELLEKHGQQIVDYANKVSEINSRKFKHTKVKDEIASDAIFYIIQKRGDIFENYEENHAIKIIKRIIHKYVEANFIRSMKVKVLSVEKMNEKTRVMDRKYGDKRTDVEAEAIEKIDEETQSENKSEECMRLLKLYYKQGYNAVDVLEKVGEDLELSRDIILEILEKELKNKRTMEEEIKE